MLWRALVFSLILPEVLLMSVTVSRNIYSGITVGLQDTLLKEDCDKLVQSIKGMFTSGSEILSSSASGLEFGSVTIVIPWQNCGKYGQVGTSKGMKTWDKSTVRIGKAHPVFGFEPWTQQPRGCGLPGNFISMSSTWLLSLSKSDKERGERLVHEWAKYRWGVFEEYGHYGDPIYPESFRNNDGSWSPNYCTNNKLDGGFTSECEEASDCEFIIHPESSNVTSSLMALPQLTQVTKFCDESNHDITLPTKQKVLCNHSSTWGIIKQHPDLKNMRKNQRNEKTVDIKLVQQSTNYAFVIAFETSSDVNQRKTFNFGKEAVAQFILYEAPSNTNLGLVSFDEVANSETSNLFNLEQEGNRKTVAEKVLNLEYSERSNRNPVNLKEALTRSAEQMGKGNGMILLMTKCTDSDPEYTPEELAEASDGNIVWILLYPKTSSKYLSLFDDLAARTGGTVLVVEQSEEDAPDTRVRLQLSQSLRQILHLEPLVDVVQMDTQVCEADVKSCTTELTFSSGFHPEVMLYVYKIPVDVISQSKSDVQVSDGNCKLDNEEFADNVPVFTTQIYLCTIKNEDSTITVTLAFPLDLEPRKIMILELVGRPVYETSDTDSFSLRFFTSSNVNIDLSYTETTAPSIFAQVFYNQSEVINASVSAISSFASVEKTSYNRIYLRDDGTGADVTGSDGIYSAYLLPVIPEGDFTLTLEATDNDGNAKLMPMQHDPGMNTVCCGSIIPLPPYLDDSPPFSLSNPYIEGTIRKSLSPGENLPPGTIKDLKAVESVRGDESEENTQPSLTLTFTATGDDLDYGTADHYVLQYSINGTTTKRETLGIIPKPSGSLETISSSFLLTCNTSYEFSVFAVDGSECRGDDSNHVTIYFPCIEDDTHLSIGAMVGIIITCIALFIVLIIIIYIIWRERNGKGYKCCEKDERTPDLGNNRHLGSVSASTNVQVIRNIYDLHGIPSEAGSDTNNANGSQTNLTRVMGHNSQPILNRSPQEGYETDSFQFIVSTSLNSLSVSSSPSIHSINQVGIPIDANTQVSYNQQHTFTLPTFEEPVPRSNPRKHILNTQV